MQRRTLILSAAGLTAPGLSATAWAQAPHGHAHSGAEIKIGPYEVELQVRGNEATLIIVDANERPVAATGFSATAVALARGNERRTIEFSPATENRLTGRVDFPFDGKFRATVTLRGPNGVVGNARYSVDAVR